MKSPQAPTRTPNQLKKSRRSTGLQIGVPFGIHSVIPESLEDRFRILILRAFNREKDFLTERDCLNAYIEQVSVVGTTPDSSKYLDAKMRIDTIDKQLERLSGGLKRLLGLEKVKAMMMRSQLPEREEREDSTLRARWVAVSGEK